MPSDRCLPAYRFLVGVCGASRNFVIFFITVFLMDRDKEFLLIPTKYLHKCEKIMTLPKVRVPLSILQKDQT